MCAQNGRVKNSTELADIFNLSASTYVAKYGASKEQHKAINAIRNCRTAVLGGNVQCCVCCGAEVNTYNSCRNRHCPKCQGLAKARWLTARQAELLPVEYFHVVFTIPHELNFLTGYNQKIIYNILFKSAWVTISTLGKDKKRLGGSTGMLAALHTWGQALLQHIHLHCIVPGGALTDKDWISTKPGFLFPVKVMSKMFRGTFVKLLRLAYENNELKLPGVVANLKHPEAFTALLNKLTKKDWCVYSKKPFNGAKGAVDYLAKYVYKTAISNNRILSCDNDKVSFNWKDYSDNNKIKTMNLDTCEFIRRFLLHVVPDRFMRIRSFGFLANACKKTKIQEILALLNQKPGVTIKEKETTDKLMLRLTGIDINLCPHCKTGKLQAIRSLPNFKDLQYLKYQDSS